MVRIGFDDEKCIGCNLCVELCPNEVLACADKGAQEVPRVVRADECCACMTCAGNCPQGALAIRQADPQKRYVDDENDALFETLSDEDVGTFARYSETLEEILKLRCKPVAISLIRNGAPIPHIAVPRVRLRYCQSLIMARRGLSILMPASSHSCPDGASILGLGKVPRKLKTGEIYVQFGKLASQEAAEKMVRERPALPENSIRATLVTPLERTVMKPDVIAVIAPPETMMWLCMASTYYTGKRSVFRMSSYNAQCVETTLYPYTTGEINMSLGCYGCRSISDIGDEMMFMGIPFVKMPTLIDGLEFLGRKAITDARAKIYLPPLI